MEPTETEVNTKEWRLRLKAVYMEVEDPRSQVGEVTRLGGVTCLTI